MDSRPESGRNFHTDVVVREGKKAIKKKEENKVLLTS
jgi:hypothetical protein